MANRNLVPRFGIKRSPTVKVFGMNKEAPLNYLGKRKQADIVSYLDDYCTEHDYVIPAVNYEYNIEAVISAIADAHQ